MIKYNLKIQRVKIIAPRKIGQRVSIQTKQRVQRPKPTHVRGPNQKGVMVGNAKRRKCT
jgi:hypothetical protein